jgi:DNA (cytosine-5)-methyltransferase 1
MRSIELFAGAGGLAMGVSLAGFQSEAVVEWDRWACDTLRENQERGHPALRDARVVEGDVRHWLADTPTEGIDLLAGGPPCQPFSMGGKHRAHDDARDMFPATVAVLRRTRPQAFIFENVKGLTRSAFANYFAYIQLQLGFPTVVRRPAEDWFAHFQRLQQAQSSGALIGRELTYNLTTTLVNAADYGVPQKRERVFFVGFRSDLGIRWQFPGASHSEAALAQAQWGDGSYWRRHGIEPALRPVPSVRELSLARQQAAELFPMRPWRTVRDALHGMPEPLTGGDVEWPDHRLQGGARSYPGHTGSPLDQPAKTIKAGDHGVPGGENMLRRVDGSVRYFSLRETARLQTFPDGYVFHGSWSEAMRQLGNAVPVALARVVASSVAEALLNAKAAAVQSNVCRTEQLG